MLFRLRRSRRTINARFFTIMSPGLKSEELLKAREKALENMRIKGAFTAQELYNGYKGTWWCVGRLC